MKNTCQNIQFQLGLRGDEPDPALEAHLASCSACSQVMKRHTSFDTAVRSTLITPVPDELTARLLALIPGLNAPLVRSRRWIMQRRIVLTLGSMLSIVALLVLGYGLYQLSLALGANELIATVSAWPASALDWLYNAVPSSREVVATLIALRQPLQWVMLAALTWLGLEHTTPRRTAEQTLVGN